MVYISYPCIKLPSKEETPGRLNVSLLNELNLAAFLGFPKPALRHCVDALGMHSGQLSDSAITASSSSHPTNFAPKIGRLHYLSSGSGTGGSWAAANNNPYQWLQADLGNWTRVTGVATQGREEDGQWVKSYSLSYGDGRFFEFLKSKSGVKKVHSIASYGLER